MVVHYQQGAGGAGADTSARITSIEDTRTIAPATYFYLFSYTGGRLSAIGGGPESYSFSYTSATLQSPLTSTGYGAQRC